jgi:Caspase domain
MKASMRLVRMLIAVSFVGLLGCSSRGPVPDVPIAKGDTDVGGMRLLVVGKPPKGDPEDEGANKLNGDWFEGLVKAFQAGALKAGFRVVEGGEHDIKAVITAENLDVRRDAMKKFAIVRAKLTSGGKSHDLLGELVYQLTETDFEVPGDHSHWMEIANTHGWYANNLLNELIKSPRLADVGGGGGNSGGSSSGGGGRVAGGFVTGAPQRNAYALVIGIEKYRDVKASALGAASDAKLFAQIAKKTMGIPDENIRIAVGDRATKGDIEKHVDWLVANVPNGGRIYLFFSGHGAPDGAEGTPFLLPYDGDPAALDRTAIPLQQILDRLEQSKAENAIAMVDTCFSGAGGRSVLPEGARPLVRVKKTKAPAKVALLSASSGEQISGPSANKKNGVFTHFLTIGIGQGKADADGDGQVTLEELATFVKPRVTREAKKQGRDQTPELSAAGGNPGDIVVAHGVK